MKKRRLIISISIIVISIGIILISKKYIKITDNISKRTTSKISETSNSENITKIDITNLNSNITIEHEHINKTTFDSENHWEQCKVCGEKINIKTHQFTSNWTMGSANNCSENNKNVFTCTCGYSYENTIGRKQHGKVNPYNHPSFYAYLQECQECSSQFNMHNCYKNDGTRISCNNLGICKTCGFDYTKENTNHLGRNYIEPNSKNINCTQCGKRFPLTINNFELVYEKENQVAMIVDLTWDTRNAKW